jgi:hypothetical protein
VYCLKLANTQHGTIPARDPERWVISNNIFKGTGSANAPVEYGIYATELTYSTISGNNLALFETGIYLGSNTNRNQVVNNKDVGCATFVTDNGTLNSIISVNEVNTVHIPKGGYNVGTAQDPFGVSKGASLQDKTIQIASNFNQSLHDLFKNGQTGFFSTFWHSPNTTDSAASAGTRIGWIDTTNGSTVNYASASDYRLKTNVLPIEPSAGLSAIEALNPVHFTWERTGTESDGFIAHEVQEVIPQAVTGNKDGVDEEGRIIPQGLDAGHMVPMIVAAIQELSRLIKGTE